VTDRHRAESYAQTVPGRATSGVRSGRSVTGSERHAVV